MTVHTHAYGMTHVRSKTSNVFTTCIFNGSFNSKQTFSDLDVLTNSMSPTAAHPTAHTYSTSNTPPLTTHLALNVCEALRGQCPCDEYRDETRNDWFFHVCTSYTSDQFRRKQLHRATTVRRQRPWTNALGGLHLPCLNRMLGCRWVDGRAVALRWYTSE